MSPKLGLMKHLMLCREFPPAPYPAGGIGTYARLMAQLMVEAGETVHVIAQRWDGAPERISSQQGGKLIIHRVSLSESLVRGPHEVQAEKRILGGLAGSTCPSQLFSWQAARYAEGLIHREQIDLVEAQEWEAPLYYLQVRRALGLGPDRQPPLFVHLHSPSGMIFAHNEWDTTLTDFLPLSRFEEYSILAADALLCPSQYLARQVSECYSVAPERIDIIPYPMGRREPLERSAITWSRDAFCYIGRLELRKGVVEWVEAAVQVASAHARVTFDFIGSDTSLGGGAGASVLQTLLKRIPQAMRSRFHFHGSRSREELLHFLAQAPVAVVPSRWENLPYTCIEAMSSGMPVLISPKGGMTELVEDGRSGWVAQDSSAEGLRSALLRILSTTPAERKSMGKRAAEGVRLRCGDSSVLAQQLAFRSRIVSQGAARSLAVPARTESTPLARAQDPGRHGMGIVLTCFEPPRKLEETLHTALDQSVPSPVAIVVNDQIRAAVMAILRDVLEAKSHKLLVCSALTTNEAGAQQDGVRALLTAFPELRAVAFVDAATHLHPDYALRCDAAFASHPHLGFVSPWTVLQSNTKELDAGPCPVSLDFPQEAAWGAGCAVRVEVLLERGILDAATRRPAADEQDHRNWSAVTYPELLATIGPRSRGVEDPQPPARRYSSMALIQSNSPLLAVRWFLSAPLEEKCRSLQRGLGQPQRVVRWMLWHVRHALASWSVPYVRAKDLNMLPSPAHEAKH